METRGERVIRFIETFCRVPEGKFVGKPLKLEAFQRRFIIETFDNPAGTRRAYLSIARKNGNSTIAAGIGLTAPPRAAGLAGRVVPRAGHRRRRRRLAAAGRAGGRAAGLPGAAGHPPDAAGLAQGLCGLRRGAR